MVTTKETQFTQEMMRISGFLQVKQCGCFAGLCFVVFLAWKTSFVSLFQEVLQTSYPVNGIDDIQEVGVYSSYKEHDEEHLDYASPKLEPLLLVTDQHHYDQEHVDAPFTESSDKPVEDVKSRSTSNNWTVLVTVNDGYYDFFLNWLWYYKKLDLDLSVVVVADDEVVYEKLKLSCEFCSVLRSDLNIKDAQNFSKTEYKAIVSSRPSHMLRLLQNGANIIYSDIDSVWLQNPVPFFNSSKDFLIQMDFKNRYCAGFMFVRSTTDSIQAIQQWMDILGKKPNNNQVAFNLLLGYMNKKVTHGFLDPLNFPSGRMYFELYNDEERSHAVVVHNNWIVGHDNKKTRFKKFNLWQI